MNDVAHNFVINRRRRPRPPGPLNSFDGDSGADADDALIRGLEPKAMTVRGSQEWARAAANRAERTRRASLAARGCTMGSDEESKDASSQTASGEGVSPAVTAEMSVEDLQPSLAEGGEAAMKALVEKAKTAPGSVFEPETVSALAQLAKTNFPAWVNLRAQLKSEAREVPISELDKRVTPNGGDASDGDDGLPGGPLKFDEIEPWDERVDGAKLLAELSSAIGAYVIMDPPQRVAVALWAVFTHAHDSFPLCAAAHHPFADEALRQNQTARDIGEADASASDHERRQRRRSRSRRRRASPDRLY